MWSSSPLTSTKAIRIPNPKTPLISHSNCGRLIQSHGSSLHSPSSFIPCSTNSRVGTPSSNSHSYACSFLHFMVWTLLPNFAFFPYRNPLEHNISLRITIPSRWTPVNLEKLEKDGISTATSLPPRISNINLGLSSVTWAANEIQNQSFGFQEIRQREHKCCHLSECLRFNKKSQKLRALKIAHPKVAMHAKIACSWEDWKRSC